MLKKLLKYDLLHIFKFLIVFYLLAFFFGILTRIFLGIENSFLMNVIGKICSGATISMIVSILINNIMRLWIRFKNNFFKDESYLTHTLPVEKKTLYASKALTTVISLFVSFGVIFLVLFISYYSEKNIEMIKNILLSVANVYQSTIIKILFAFLFVFFLEVANLLQTGYTGILIGHRRNNGKIGFSVLFGFLSYMLTQFFVLFVLFIVALFRQDIMNLFVTNEMITVDVMKGLIYLSIMIYTVTLLIGYFINVKIFQKGVNVD